MLIQIPKNESQMAVRYYIYTIQTYRLFFRLPLGGCSFIDACLSTTSTTHPSGAYHPPPRGLSYLLPMTGYAGRGVVSLVCSLRCTDKATRKCALA